MLRAFRRVQQYIKHDIKEIVAPSALPEPPGEEAWRLTAAEIWKVSTVYEKLLLEIFTSTTSVLWWAPLRMHEIMLSVLCRQ